MTTGNEGFVINGSIILISTVMIMFFVGLVSLATGLIIKKKWLWLTGLILTIIFGLIFLLGLIIVLVNLSQIKSL